MRALTTFTEDFHLNLLPKVIQEVDEKGYIRAVVGGWQDRIEELRALVDQYSAFLEPMVDQAAVPNTLVFTFTSTDGKEVRRHLHITPYLEAAVAILNNPNADKSVLLEWGDQLLGLKEESVSSVELGYNPRMAPLSSTLGLLAKTLGVMPLPDGVDPSIQRRLTRDQLAWTRSKGTARAIYHRMYALGFSEVVFTPLWSRLSPRMPLYPQDRGEVSGGPPAEFDLRGRPDTYPELEDWNPEELRDGPYSLWEQACSLLDPAAFYTSVNGSSPFVRVLIHGLDHTNHRRAWNEHSQYVQGDVVTHASKVYVAKDPPIGIPGAATSSGWSELLIPDTGTYTLSGGVENIRASVTLPSTDPETATPSYSGITLEAIAPGASYNGVEVVVKDWVWLKEQVLATVSAPQRLSFGNFAPGRYKLSYGGGCWHADSRSVHQWRATKSPTGYANLVAYSAGTPYPFNEPTPDNPDQYAFPYGVEAICRDLAVTIDHAGGELWLEWSAESYTYTEVGTPPLAIELEQLADEMRTLSVYTRLSRVKYRSSHFDVTVANETVLDQPVQPNPALVDDPKAYWPLTATAPYRPWGGYPLAQVDATKRQVNVAKLLNAAALAAAAVEDWRPATRTPRRVEVGIVILDSFRVAPYNSPKTLFTTNGVTTSFSGTVTEPMLPNQLGEVIVEPHDGPIGIPDPLPS